MSDAVWLPWKKANPQRPKRGAPPEGGNHNKPGTLYVRVYDGRFFLPGFTLGFFPSRLSSEYVWHGFGWKKNTTIFLKHKLVRRDLNLYNILLYSCSVTGAVFLTRSTKGLRLGVLPWLHDSVLPQSYYLKASQNRSLTWYPKHPRIGKCLAVSWIMNFQTFQHQLMVDLTKTSQFFQKLLGWLRIPRWLIFSKTKKI